MNKKAVLFSDIDGTICFHRKIHGINKVKSLKSGFVLVEDIINDKIYKAYDVSTKLYDVYFAVKTYNLIKSLKSKYYIILATGSRPSFILSRRDIFNFADAVIIENGGAILDKHFELSKSWYKKLHYERVTLQKITKSLESKGWVLDNEDRTSSIRIRKMDNPYKTEEEFQTLFNDMLFHETLDVTENIGHIDIILRSAGKANAARYLLSTKRLGKCVTYGIGDDLNDILLLETVHTKFVLANSHPKLLLHATQRNWQVSKLNNIEGINEILNTLKEK